MKRKKYECLKCKKKYCYLGWALKHGQIDGHHKFRELVDPKKGGFC